MKKMLLLSCVIILTFNCKKEPEYFFDFDEVVHYETDMDEMDMIELRKKQFNSLDDQLVYLYIGNPHLRKIDTVSLSRLKYIGFSETCIPGNKYPALREIFKEKSIDEEMTTACEPIFNDILVFRKKNKTIGIAKLCFHCSQSQFIGAKANTRTFGYHNEFEGLKKLLK